MKEVCLLPHPDNADCYEHTAFLHRMVDQLTVVPLYCPRLVGPAICGQVCVLFDVEMEQGEPGKPSRMFALCQGTRIGRLRIATGQEFVRT